MRITAVETVPVSVPLDPERMITSSRGSHDRSPYLLVRVRTDEGIEGVGEASCTPRWSGEDSVTATRVVERYLAPRLLDADPCAVEARAVELDDAIVGHHFTKAAVEMALWDIAGQAAGLPVYRLLGGPLRERVRTKFSISGNDAGRAVELGRWAVEQGFTAMKCKVATGPLQDDVDRVGGVREAVGDDVLLGVDANGGWSRAEGRAGVPHMEELGIAFLEQPLGPRDLEGMAELRASTTIPVMADDCVGTPEDAIDVVRAEAADVLSLYVGMAGGIAAARRAAGIAHAAGLGWTIGSNLELGVGLAAHIHLAISTPGLCDDLIPCDIISTFYYPTLLLAEDLPIGGGWAAAPERPGLGAVVDWEAVERYREDR
jgi:muconate cycloisomerase